MTAPSALPTPSKRLGFRPMPWAAVDAIVLGERLSDWAADYPDEGDAVIAGALHGGGPAREGDEAARDGLWGHYQLVERSSDLVVGGIGFFGPPRGGVTEIGYGVVPSCQGRGFATEAVVALVCAAWEHEQAQEIVAETDVDNAASQRVLQKAGFVFDRSAGVGIEGRRYRIVRPPHRWAPPFP